MTHLRIENQNSNVEIVNAAIILKLYNLALGVEENLEEGESLSDYVLLKGNLLVDKCKESAYNYLTGNLPDSDNKRFPNLSINVTVGKYIDFADPEVERVLLANNIGDGNGITLADAAALTGLFDGNHSPFMNNTSITSFDEFEYFGYTSLYSNQWETGAFRGCSNLLSISLKNVTSIGGFTFHLCSSLLTVKDFHPTSIGLYAFNNTSISSIDLSLATSIGGATFRNCSSLTTVDLSNVTTIGELAFINCTGLTGTIDLSSLTSVSGDANKGPFLGCTGIISVTNLNKANAYYMFYGCTGLTSVTLTLNCTNIALGAFSGCSSLSSVSGLSNVTKIGDWGFSNCRNLSLNVSLLLNLQEIGSHAFAYDSLVTGDLNLPNLTRYIENGAFYNTSITKILSLGHIQGIQAADSNAESRAFGGCTSLTEVDLSTTTSLTSIGTAAFVGCTSLTLVKLPSSITSIEGWAFTASNNVIQTRTYYIYATTPPTLNAKHSIVSDATVASLPAAIYVPAGSVEDYKAASIWSDFASVILAIPE